MYTTLPVTERLGLERPSDLTRDRLVALTVTDLERLADEVEKEVQGIEDRLAAHDAAPPGHRSRIEVEEWHKARTKLKHSRPALRMVRDELEARRDRTRLFAAAAEAVLPDHLYRAVWDRVEQMERAL